MKRYFYLAAAIAGLLMAASCQKESFGSLDGDYADVLFTTEIPSGVATRAIADGTTVNKLYYEVYEVTGEGENRVMGDSPEIDAVAAISGGRTTISVRLQKNKKYTAIFWAQYEPESTPQDGESTASPYDVRNLKSIKVSYDNASANDETRDAFYAVVPNVESRTTAYDVTLKRPFAQVNVATSDYAEISSNEVNYIQSALKVTNVANTFKPLDNTATVSGNEELTAIFTKAASPDETLTIGNNTTYKYLAMAYVLVPSNAETSISTISSDIWLNGVNEPISVSYEGATLKQNHRTNLIGNILTGYTNFNIVVDKDFDNDNTYAVASYEALEAAINAEGTYKNITLTSDITFGEDENATTINIPTNQKVILNLNGNTLTNNIQGARAFEITGNNVNFMVNAEGSNVTFDNDTYGFIRLKEGVSGAIVTINGGTFNGKSNTGTLIRFTTGGNNLVTLNNVTYTDSDEFNTGENANNATVVYAPNDGIGAGNKLVVNGGEFSAIKGFIVPFDSEYYNAKISAYLPFELKSVKDGATGTHKVENCKVFVTENGTIGRAPSCCIAASWESIVTVNNCYLKAQDPSRALHVYSSGGNITAKECTIEASAEYLWKVDKDGSTIKFVNCTLNESTTVNGTYPEQPELS